jgi:hypothetical protein
MVSPRWQTLPALWRLGGYPRRRPVMPPIGWAVAAQETSGRDQILLLARVPPVLR